jgi:hypothetical protein
MSTWRAARSLLVLRAEIDKAHPTRDKTADGIIGDQAHQQRHSDHNPDPHGVVHAIDITTKPGEAIDADTVVERIRQLGKAGDPRLLGNGYVIYQRRIASAAHQPAWEWHPYTGSDPHTGHFHLSVTLSAACDEMQPWGLYDTAPTHPDPPLPTEEDMPFVITNEDNSFSFVIDGGKRRRIDGPDRADGDVTLAECRHLFPDNGKASTRLIVAISDPDRADD